MVGWKKDSKDAKYLRGLFASGEVEAHNSPKYVYEKHSNNFGKYELDSFCGAFNRMKKEMGLDLRPAGVGGKFRNSYLSC